MLLKMPAYETRSVTVTKYFISLATLCICEICHQCFSINVQILISSNGGQTLHKAQYQFDLIPQLNIQREAIAIFGKK